MTTPEVEVDLGLRFCDASLKASIRAKDRKLLATKRPPRRRPQTWTPLPDPLPDRPWRVTRDVQVQTKSPNRIMREHWKSRSMRRKLERQATWDAFRDAYLAALDTTRGVIVTFVRVGPYQFDSDRLAGSLYSVRDAIAEILGMPDDSPRSPIEWVYRQHVMRVREPHHVRATKTRLARDTWRYVSFVRICIESGVEPAAGPLGAQCDPPPSEPRLACVDPPANDSRPLWQRALATRLTPDGRPIIEVAVDDETYRRLDCDARVWNRSIKHHASEVLAKHVATQAELPPGWLEKGEPS